MVLFRGLSLPLLLIKMLFLLHPVTFFHINVMWEITSALNVIAGSIVAFESVIALLSRCYALCEGYDCI